VARSGSLTITMSPPDRADPIPPGPVDSVDGAPGEAPITDGRLLRRQRNRDAVVESLLDLYAEGNLRPSTEEIAARSGLSPRSLFRYFDDVEDLTRTAMNRQLERALPLLPIDAGPEAELTVKVGALVDQRFRLFDLFGPAATISRLRSPFQPVLANQLTLHRKYLRSQVRKLFAPELAAMGEPVGFEILAAADIMASFESYQLLVEHRALEQGQAKSVMRRALEAILGPPG
jgi:AcrR family transcriptional regulator